MGKFEKNWHTPLKCIFFKVYLILVFLNSIAFSMEHSSITLSTSNVMELDMGETSDDTDEFTQELDFKKLFFPQLKDNEPYINGNELFSQIEKTVASDEAHLVLLSFMFSHFGKCISFTPPSYNGWRISKKKELQWVCPTHKKHAYRSYDPLRRHIKNHHYIYSSGYACVFCTLTFCAPEEVIKHLEHDHKSFILCCRTLWSLGEHVDHKRRCGNVIQKQGTYNALSQWRTLKKEGPFRCLCKRTFTGKNVSALFRHVKNYHTHPLNTEYFACPHYKEAASATTCKKTFERPSEVIHHLVKIHNSFKICCKQLWTLEEFNAHTKKCSNAPRQRNFKE